MTFELCDTTHANLDPLSGKAVAVIGYGNQGRAHALNLRDSDVSVIVGQRDKSASHERAVRDGFEPVSASQAAQSADVLIITLPDESAADVYSSDIAPNLRSGQTLGFVHGFNIRFGFIAPPDFVSTIMIAPKGPGRLLRSLYVEGKGLPALLAVHHDADDQARNIALAWATAIGSSRAGVVETTFAAETEADLFGEQVVLCGGVTALMKAAFETLTDAGFDPELAYLECIHELKQVVDLVYQDGISTMRDRISNTAAYGDLTRGPRLIDDETRARMRTILAEIQSGEFAREWIEECKRGGATFNTLLKSDPGLDIESAGRNVRSLMPWLNANEKQD
jgi:ketol-acid reductoisomerase